MGSLIERKDQKGNDSERARTELYMERRKEGEVGRME